jgi:hypothetical protein
MGCVDRIIVTSFALRGERFTETGSTHRVQDRLNALTLIFPLEIVEEKCQWNSDPAELSCPPREPVPGPSSMARERFESG